MGFLDKIIPKELKSPATLINPAFAVQGALLSSAAPDPKKSTLPRLGTGVGGLDVFPSVDIPNIPQQPRIPSPEVLTGADIDRIRARLPQVDLSPYLGTRIVDLPESLRNTINLTNELVTGETGNFRQLLEGEPDFRQIQLLEGLERQQLQNFTLPGIESGLSSGPFGETLRSGQRARSVTQAQTELAEGQANRRFQAAELAKDRSLQAASLLPNFAQVQDIERVNSIANLERTINVHFANEDIKLQEFNAALQNYQAALAEAGFIVQQKQFGASFQFSQNQLDQQALMANQGAAATEAQLNLQGQIAGAELTQQREFANLNLQLQERALREAEKAAYANLIGTLGGAAIGGALGAGAGGSLGAVLGASAGGSLGGGIGSAVGGGGVGPLTSSISQIPLTALIMKELGVFTPQIQTQAASNQVFNLFSSAPFNTGSLTGLPFGGASQATKIGNPLPTSTLGAPIGG